MKQKYRVETEPVQYSQIIDSKESNEIIFINKGTAVAEVDGFPLSFNEFITDGGNKDEINVNRYNITFAATGTRNLFVRRKFYV